MSTLDLIPEEFISGTKVDLAIYKGAKWEVTLTLTDSAGTAIDITSDTFYGQIRNRGGDLQAAFTFTISDGPNGVVVLSLAKSVVDDIAAANGNKAHQYDVFRAPSGSDPLLLIRGEVQVFNSITDMSGV